MNIGLDSERIPTKLRTSFTRLQIIYFTQRDRAVLKLSLEPTNI